MDEEPNGQRRNLHETRELRNVRHVHAEVIAIEKGIPAQGKKDGVLNKRPPPSLNYGYRQQRQTGSEIPAEKGKLPADKPPAGEFFVAPFPNKKCREAEHNKSASRLRAYRRKAREHAGGEQALDGSFLDEGCESCERQKQAEPMVRGVESVGEGEAEEKCGGQKSSRAAKHAPRDGNARPGHSRSNDDQNDCRNPRALAEDRESAKIKPFGSRPSQLKDVAVEDFSVRHARRIQQIDRSVVALIDGDEWKDKG